MITTLHLKDVKGISGSFELGKITNIIGPNGSGKSAILDSIKIGLTGYTNLGKLAGKTFKLASGRSMEISMESAMGRTLSRKFERSGAGAKQTIMVNGEPVAEKDLEMPACFNYPVEAIHPAEFLDLSDEKRADYVFSALPEEINSISPEEIKQKLAIFTQKTGFSELLETLKAKKGELEKEIKRCIANIQKLTGEAGELPAGSLNEWEEKKKVAAAELEKVTGEIATNKERANLAASKTDQAARLQKNIDDASAKITAAQNKIAELSGKKRSVLEHGNLQALKSESYAKQEALTVATSQLQDLDKKLKVLNDKGCCPYCNSLLTALEDSLDQWELESSNLTFKIDELREDLANLVGKIQIAEEAEKAKSQNEADALAIKVETDAAKSYTKFRAESEDALTKLNAGTDEAPVSLDILHGKAEGLRVQIAEAESNIKKFVSIQSVRSQKSKSESERMELEKNLEDLKEALDSVKKIRDARLADATVSLASTFKTIVEAAFGCPSYLTLISENDKPCFDFGIVIDDREIGFDTLSGGEKTILLTALVACIQIIKSGTPGIGLFELAEADADRVKGLIAAAKKIGFEQIIIASCHGQPIEGATNIFMYAGEQKEYVWSESSEVAA